MPNRFRRVALVGKYQAQGIGPLLNDIAQQITDAGMAVVLEAATAENTGITTYPACSIAALGQQADVAVVVGGDGTMLGIARELARQNVPLVGINHGRLGFITDIPLDRVRETLAPILAGDYETDERAMLDGSIWRDGVCIDTGLSLNDVVVSRGATAGMVELKIDIGDDFVANMRADGLIVATPTGSTAYALSAGGPLLHPKLGGWVLVPIASHTLSNRPIVLPDDATVQVEIVAGKDASCNFDMQGLTSLQHGDQIRISRSQHQVRFLHPMGWSYYATLRRKLRWYEGNV
jgi:NAD+ kinase